MLITEAIIQPSENQDIVDADKESGEKLNELLKKFIQQSPQKSLILISKNVQNVFELLKTHLICIEAAGGLIKNSDRYLFIFRLGKWDLPKGKIDKGESREQAAVRECEEECGISGLTILDTLPDTYHIYNYKGRQALKITYWYQMSSNFGGTLVPQTEENIEKAEWMDKNSIKTEVLANTYPSVSDLIEFMSFG